MSLFESLFPDLAQLEDLKELRKHNEYSIIRNRRKDKRATAESEKIREENEQLRNDLGVLTLTLASLISAIKKKGLLTEIEIKEMVNELDLLDNIKDGQLDVNVLRELNKK